MELLVIVLNKTEYLTEILEDFVDVGINGATVIESSGMGHLLADHLPLFSQFVEFEFSDEGNSKTIFTVTSCCKDKDNAVEVVERHIGSLDEPDTAFVFSVPVNFVKGIRLESCGDC